MDNSIDIKSLVPHAKPMCLIDALFDHGSDFIVCTAIPRQDGLFNIGARVPALVGLEYMAQSVAAFSGLNALHLGEPPKMGFLLGTRKFRSNVDTFKCGDPLKITARQAVQSSEGMAAFDCTLEGEGVQQSARLAVYEPKNPDKFLSRKEY